MGSPVFFSRGVRLIGDMIIWRERGEDREHKRRENNDRVVCSTYTPDI